MWILFTSIPAAPLLGKLIKRGRLFSKKSRRKYIKQIEAFGLVPHNYTLVKSEQSNNTPVYNGSIDERFISPNKIHYLGQYKCKLDNGFLYIHTEMILKKFVDRELIDSCSIWISNNEQVFHYTMKLTQAFE